MSSPPTPSPSGYYKGDGNPAAPTVWQGNSWWGGSNIDWLLASSPNDISLDPHERCRQYGFLLHLGDYAGRLFHCLRTAAISQDLSLGNRVVPLRDNLTDESHDPSPEARHTTWVLERSCRYLSNMNLLVDSEMAELAIRSIHGHLAGICCHRITAECPTSVFSTFLHPFIQSTDRQADLQSRASI
ncbi:hypothetical protein P168DRAFT_346124 [Aspergillus campestris IBT 28561]|uniref:Uncharacterized protein n=1 Tax=Aspergillus campestris (strain IBT 28561) TaxID=1392248 RepID=A0A2I1D0P4_ASPC2|nr:uncharacterized protein P168DRAFT_346124 [Aspergillus campestris IBT 28561]PKY03427.1 hypothetical protein P168DRAFT_346124 [Aspergillus campestris IBT 28561]